MDDAPREAGEPLAAADVAYRPLAPFEEWAAVHVDRAGWDAARDRMLQRRAAASTDDLRRAVETAMRAAAIDTGAIEGLYDVDRGLTVSVAMQTVAWQALVNEKGPYVRDLFEAQLRAYELALDAATGRLPITEAWIRRLHEVVSQPQKTVRVLTDLGWQEQQFTRGRYKSHPNHVRLPDGRVHSYAPVAETPAEMHRLVDQLARPEFAAAHPVLQAAYVHHGLVAIHPFQDGNGRVARALASVYLYRSASIPLLIFQDQRQDYFDRLAEADGGGRQGFVDFVSERVADAMELVADSIGAGVEDRLAGLRSLLTAQGGLSHAEIDQMASGLLEAVQAAVGDRIGATVLPPGVSLFVYQGRATRPPDNTHRPVESMGGRNVGVSAQVASPVRVQATTDIDVTVATAPDARFPFRVRALDEVLDVRLADLHPVPTAVLRLRIDTWVSRVLTALLDQLQRETGRALEENGHS